ncbi:MAG: hypothetical protein ACKPKO_54605 [Candidatus Fonsibacter sp.]
MFFDENVESVSFTLLAQTFCSKFLVQSHAEQGLLTFGLQHGAMWHVGFEVCSTACVLMLLGGLAAQCSVCSGLSKLVFKTEMRPK